MKLSLFTPTNDPRYLAEAYASLLAQSYDNFEWLILLNGPIVNSSAPVPSLTTAIANDPRVRVEIDDTGSDKIGQLKLRAISYCTGDGFVEFDHDDMLVPGALESAAKALEAGAGFVYSDSAVFEDNMRTWGYSPTYGWEHYPVMVYNERFVVTRTFPLSPRMLCEIFYAPDHYRCWSREAYYEAGGHDPELSVGDDHDLICRTYLSGVPFHYTGDCGYLYRVHDSNTVKRRNDAIQEQQANNRRKYLWPLVQEWCRREDLPILNLREEMKAGRWDPERPASYEKCDRSDYYGAVVLPDLLARVKPEDQVRVMNTVYRTLVPGGYAHITVPASTGRYADMNPMHRTRFNENSFLYYCRREFAQNLEQVDCRFDQVQCETFYPDENFKKFDMQVIRVDLCALKGQKHPGQDLI